MKLEKGQKAVYFGAAKVYILANDQRVSPGEQFDVLSDVNVNDNMFSIVVDTIEVFDLDELHVNALKENKAFDEAVKKEQAAKAKADKQ